MLKKLIIFLLVLNFSIFALENFPGDIPKDAQRIKNEIVKVDMFMENLSYLKINYQPGFWRSTGLYAPPDEKIIINVPKGVKNLIVQIGSHTDGLWEIKPDERLRNPEILRTLELKEGINEFSNPYGGLIYFIPTVSQNKIVDISVSGAIRAPYYVLNKTKDSDWEKIKNYPGNFAELEGEKVVLTIPKWAIKNLNNPKELLLAWDNMVSMEQDLFGLTETSGMSKIHKTKWRYVADIQISWGYMYCGYPIMLYAPESIEAMVDVNLFKTEGWGFWHELGHNYQMLPFDAPSLAEVSNNLYSLYVEEKYGMPSRLLDDNDGTGNSSFFDALNFVKSSNPNKNFIDDNQTTCWTRLVMMWQLKEAFGWDFYKKLFTEYRKLDKKIYPKNEAEVFDRFVLMSSKLSTYNLSEFFDKWAIPYSNPTKKEINKLPLPTSKLWLHIPNTP